MRTAARTRPGVLRGPPLRGPGAVASACCQARPRTSRQRPRRAEPVAGGVRRARPHGAAFSLAIPSAPLTGSLKSQPFSDQRCLHPKSALSCVWRKRVNVDGRLRGGQPQPSPGRARSRQSGATLGVDRGGLCGGQRAVAQHGNRSGWVRRTAPPLLARGAGVCPHRSTWACPAVRSERGPAVLPSLPAVGTAVLGRPGASGLRGGLGSTWGGPRLPPAVPVHSEAPPGSWRPEEGAQRAASPASALGDGGRVGVLPLSLLPVTDQSPAPWSVSIPVREQCGCTPRAPQGTCLQASGSLPRAAGPQFPWGRGKRAHFYP